MNYLPIDSSFATWLEWIILIGGAVVGLGTTWQKGIAPLYRHLKRLNASILAASEVIRAQLPVNGGEVLLDLVSNIDQRSRTAEEQMVRLDDVVSKLEIAVSRVPSLIRMVVKEELSAQNEAAARVAVGLAATTLDTASALATVTVDTASELDAKTMAAAEHLAHPDGAE